jgi:hypothetical protein
VAHAVHDIAAHAGQFDLLRPEDRRLLVRLLIADEVEVVGRREADLRQVRPRDALEDHEEPVGIVIGGRPQQHGVDEAEHRGVGPDAERERRDDHDREAGRFDEGTSGEPEIVRKRQHG